MSTYLIGDVQGCYQELQNLLAAIDYQPDRDQLNFAGDLVSRGPDSLAVLRFIKSLKNSHIVLGNHDLHLLCVGHHVSLPHPHDFDAILNAPDKNDLLEWLRFQPILHVNQQQNYAMVHAGIPPQWNMSNAIEHANALSDALKGEDFLALLQNMFGHEPTKWHDNLTGFDRLRYITNGFTRIRFCTIDGELDLVNKGATIDTPNTYRPWFEWTQHKTDIVFGHWAALEGQCSRPHYYAIDTGCVWGGRLSALRIEDKKLFSVAAT